MATYENPYAGVTPLQPHVFDPSVYLSAYPKNLPSWLPEEQMQAVQMRGQALQNAAQQIANLPAAISGTRRTMLENQIANRFMEKALAGQGPPFQLGVGPQGTTLQTQTINPAMLGTGQGNPLAPNVNPTAGVTPKPAGLVADPRYPASQQNAEVSPQAPAPPPAAPKTPPVQVQQPAAEQPAQQPPPQPPQQPVQKTSQAQPSQDQAALAILGGRNPYADTDQAAAPPVSDIAQAAQAPATSVPAAVPSLAAAGVTPPRPAYAPTSPQPATGQSIFDAYQNTISPDARTWHAEMTPTGQRTGRIIVQHKTNPRTGQPILPDQPIDPQWASQNLFGSQPRQAHPVIAGLAQPQDVALAMGAMAGQRAAAQQAQVAPIQNMPGQGMNVAGPAANAPIGPAPGAIAVAPPVQNLPGPGINVPRGPIIPPGPQIAAAAPPQGGPALPGGLPSGPVPPYIPQAAPSAAGFQPQIPTTPAGIIAAGGGQEGLAAEAGQRAGTRTDVAPRAEPVATPAPGPQMIRQSRPGGTDLNTYPYSPDTSSHDANGNATPAPGSAEFWTKSIGQKDPSKFGVITGNPNVQILNVGKGPVTLNGAQSDSFTYKASDGQTYTMYVDPIKGGVDANGRAIANLGSEYVMTRLSPFAEERTYLNGDHVVVHNQIAEQDAAQVDRDIIENGVNYNPQGDTAQQLQADWQEAMQRKLAHPLPEGMAGTAKAYEDVYSLSNQLQSLIQQIPPGQRQWPSSDINKFTDEHGASIPDWLANGVKWGTGGHIDLQHADQLERSARKTFDALYQSLGELPEANARALQAKLGDYQSGSLPANLNDFVHSNLIPDAGRFLEKATSMGFRVPVNFKNMTMAGQYGEDRSGGTANHPVDMRNQEDVTNALPQTYLRDSVGNIVQKDATGRLRMIRRAAQAVPAAQ